MRVSLVRRCLFLVLVLVGGLVAVPAAPAAVKPFSLTISPGTVGGGPSVQFRATFAVPQGAQQQLGSADLTPPAGFRLVAASVASPATATISATGTLQLRNLAVQPNGSVVVGITADVPCTPVTSATWTVKAKQANDFNGPPGNDLTLDPKTSSLTTSVTGTCGGTALRFVNAPAPAATAATTATTGPVILSGSGAPVSVEVIDSAGNRVASNAPITLSVTPNPGPGAFGGVGPVGANAGLATFPDLRIVKPGSYQLTASSPGLTSVTSATFTVDTVVATCPAGGTCTGSANTGPSTLTITGQAAADAGVLRLSFGVGFALNCPGYTELTPGTALFTVTGNREKLASLRIDSTVMNAQPDNGVGTMQLCFGSPAPFTTRAGTPALSSQPRAFDWNGDGTPDTVFFGLLPDCNPQQGPPCVSNRQKNAAGDGIIEARIPAGLGDPLMRG